MSPRYILLVILALGGRAFAAEAKAPSAPAATPPAATPAPRPAGPEAARGGRGAAAAPAPRNDSAVAPSAAFDTFRLISDRNIFSPYRTGARRDRGNEEVQPRTDVITLTGTAADKGERAFFDGSSPGYRKTLRAGDAIDQFKIVKISPHVVEFERDGKALSLRVGQQFRRPEGGEWTVVGEDIARRDTQQVRGSTSSGGAAAKAAEIPDNADPVLRKLMEARQKQLKQ